MRIADVRLGHHPDTNTTRLVLDCSVRPKYHFLKSSVHVVVTIENAALPKPADRDCAEGFVERVRFEKVGGSVAALVSFRRAFKVTHSYVPPSKTCPYHRVVLDFAGKSGPGRNKKCIILDPGHGGWHHGARGNGKYSPLREKDIVLDIAKRVHQIFKTEDNVDCVDLFLTRTSDRLPFVRESKVNQEPPLSKRLSVRSKSLDGRVRFAEEKAETYGKDNCLFVSLHVNWAKNKRAHGFEVYLANDSAVSSEERSLLEKRENAGGRPTAVESRMARLVRREARESSETLARYLIAELNRIEGMQPHGSNGGLFEANFRVLRTLDFPAALAEVGYLSNSADARRLSQSGFRDQAARAMYNAIVKYFRARDEGFPLRPAALPVAQEYRVRPGDTLLRIARKFGKTSQEISRANRLRNPDRIQPGQVLKIPI